MFTPLLIALLAALPPGEILVETDALGSLKNPLILDARGEKAYTQAHLPGAIHLDPQTLSETRDGVAGLLKPLDQIAEILADKAVDPRRHIVVYSQMHEATDLKNAARLFWILEYLSYPRVSVLNGGFAKWSHEARPTESGMPAPIEHAQEEWVLKTRPGLLATRQEVLDAIENGNAALLDLRSPEEYSGLSKKDFIAQSGHIHGACNLPAADVVEGPFFTLKSPEQLRESVAEAGAPEEKPVITYCNSGRDASTGYLSLRLTGRKNISLYDGSMAEWGNQPVPEQP